MRLITVFCIFALLAGCGQVASMRAYTDGTCMGDAQAVNPENNVQITRVKEGSTVTCTIKFEVTK